MKLGKRLLPILLTLSMAASMLPAAALAAEADTGEKHITILGTSDMHGNIWGFSYEDNAETANNGMARLYTYIQQVRAENPNTILIDAGDDIQGTIMTDDLYNKTPEEPHPVVTAMNYMGYDAMTLGNHEFNWGIPTMQTILSQAEFPVLAANVTDEKGELVTGAGWTIVERDGVKVAIIGVVTPDVPIWDGGKEGIEGATFEAANVAVGKAIDEIGDQADVIVGSAHMGMYAEFDEEGGSDSAQKILDDNPEIDVLQVAHNHVVVNEKQGDVVIGGVRNGGRDIARFDLTLDADNNVVDATVEVVDMTDVTPSQEIRDIPLVAEAHPMRAASLCLRWAPPPPSSSPRTRSAASPPAVSWTPPSWTSSTRSSWRTLAPTSPPPLSSRTPVTCPRATSTTATSLTSTSSTTPSTGSPSPVPS